MRLPTMVAFNVEPLAETYCDPLTFANEVKFPNGPFHLAIEM
jgi:hypothetical protein